MSLLLLFNSGRGEVNWPGVGAGRRERGPDVGLARDLARQRQEEAERVAAERQAEQARQRAEAAEAQRVKTETGCELTPAERARIAELFKIAPTEPAIIAPVVQTKQELRQVSEEEELTLLLLLAH
jgi:hypothetical protein